METYVSSNCSTFTSDMEALDKLYMQQLQELGYFVNKIKSLEDVNRCIDWVNLFNKTETADKVTRNCLSTLMISQIRECACLGEPFTIANNLNRSLAQVLNGLDVQTLNSCKTYNSHKLPLALDQTLISCKTYDSHEAPPSEKSATITATQLTEQQIPAETNTKELQKKVQEMRMLLKDQTVVNEKLRNFIKIQELKCEKINFKTAIMRNIKQTLQEKKKEATMLQMNIFAKLFSGFEQSAKFEQLIKSYDKDLNALFVHIIQTHIESFTSMITEYIRAKLHQRKRNLKANSSQFLKLQSAAQILNVKSFHMETAQKLQKHLIKMRAGEETNILQLLSNLEPNI